MKIRALVLPLIALVFATGCGVGASNPGNEVLQQGLTNLYYDTTSAKFDLSVNADIVAPEGQTPAKVTFEATLSGDMDNTNPSEPKFNMVLKGGGKADEEAQEKVSAEMKSDSKLLYFVVNEITSFGGALPEEQVKDFLGKWYKMEIPAETFASLDKKSEMTEEEKKIKELAEKTNFMKDIKFEGTKKIMGEECYVYSAFLDKEAVKNFMVEVAKIEDGVEPSESEIADLETQLEMFGIEGKFYVGVEDKVLRGAEGSFVATPEGGKITVDFKLSMGDLNKAVNVEAPASAELFDPMMLMGGAAMMDPSTVDYSSLEGMEGLEGLEGMEGFEMEP